MGVVYKRYRGHSSECMPSLVRRLQYNSYSAKFLSAFHRFKISLCIELYVCVPTRRHGQLKCVRLLLERGARMVPDNEGVSPLELCAQVTNPSIAWRRGPTLES